MSSDIELENWRRQWQGGANTTSGTDDVERLRQRVMRETRWATLSLGAPVLVTVLIGGGVVLRALRSGQTLDIVLAVESWIFIVAVWVGCLVIARGTWRPLANTTAAFVDISIRRREANLRGATFGTWCYVLQVLFLAGVFVVTSGDVVAVLTSWPVILLGWVGMPTMVASLRWFRRSQRAELERLRELEGQLHGE